MKREKERWGGAYSRELQKQEDSQRSAAFQLAAAGVELLSQQMFAGFCSGRRREVNLPPTLHHNFILFFYFISPPQPVSSPCASEAKRFSFVWIMTQHALLAQHQDCQLPLFHFLCFLCFSFY